MKFVHCADVHLDSPMVGLAARADAPVDVIRLACRRAFQNIVDLCLAEHANFLVIAGDLYDGDWRDFGTGLFFVQQMNRLRDAGVPVYLARGNHDAASQITRSLRLPENVRVFDTRSCQTFVDENLGVALHGQSFPRREVTDNIARNYCAPISGAFNIGVLHTDLSGGYGHQPYAPCDLSQLMGHGYDYWALGHVHRRTVLNHAPMVVYPGNVQGRHIKETGPKGCTLVDVNGTATTEHRAVDVFRWHDLEIDAAGATSPHDIIDRTAAALIEPYEAAEGRPLAVRVRVTGRSPAHAALVQEPDRWRAEIQAAAPIATSELWVQDVILITMPEIDLDALRGHNDALAELLRTVQGETGDGDALQTALNEALEAVLSQAPGDVRTDLTELFQGEARTRFLQDVQLLLHHRLSERLG